MHGRIRSRLYAFNQCTTYLFDRDICTKEKWNIICNHMCKHFLMMQYQSSRENWKKAKIKINWDTLFWFAIDSVAASPKVTRKQYPKCLKIIKIITRHFESSPNVNHMWPWQSHENRWANKNWMWSIQEKGNNTPKKCHRRRVFW